MHINLCIMQNEQEKKRSQNPNLNMQPCAINLDTQWRYSEQGLALIKCIHSMNLIVFLTVLHTHLVNAISVSNVAVA